MPARQPLSIVMIGSEVAPFSKTGGLADVLGALPLALGRLGHDVSVVTPKYRDIESGAPVVRSTLTIGGTPIAVALSEHVLGPCTRAILVDCPELYDRKEVYGEGGHDYPDSPRRFAVLVRAALEWIAWTGRRPSLIHAHDWQAGLAPVYLKTRYAADPLLGGLPAVFTIHNLSYQGLCEAGWLPRLDLPWDLYTADRLEFWGQVSLLKAGITYGDVVTTVSRRYADEIQTPEYGCGLDGVLGRRRANLFGITNGIDTSQWNPATDRHLPVSFSADDLTGKAAAKRAVLDAFGFPESAVLLARPLIGLISRLVNQKGLDLLAAIADELPRLDATFVVLGTGEPRYQDLWTALADAHPGRIAAKIGFSETLAHLIEGGADIFLMPSRFEPCGLNQMYSLRYGTVPVVRATGGLADTVTDADGPSGTGFTFTEYTGAALLGALRRALAAYANPRRWRALQRTGMSQNHSWDKVAGEYVKLYDRTRRQS